MGALPANGLPPGYTITPAAPAAAPTAAVTSLPPGYVVQSAPPPDVGSDVRNSAVNGLQQGWYGLLGLPGDATTGLNNAVNWGRGMLGNAPLPNVVPPIPGTADIEKRANFTPYQPQTPWGHIASTAASFAPMAAAAGLTGGASAVPAAVARGVAMGAATGALGNAAADKFGEAMRPWAELGGSLLSGYGVSKVAGTASRTATRMAAPTADALRNDATTLYRAADNAGVAVKPTTVDNIYSDVVQAGWARGLRENRPKTQDAIGAAKALADEVARVNANGGATLQDLKTMKEIVNDAQPEGSAAAGAMAAKLKDRVSGLTASDITSGTNPQAALGYVRAADGLWTQQSKAQTIDKIISDAKLSQKADAPGAYPAALQNGFKALAKDPNFKKYWTPEEQTAIVTAAKGGGFGPAIVRLAGRTVGTGGIVPGLNVVGWGIRGVGNMATTNAAAYASALARSGGANPFTMALPLPRTGQDVATAAASGALPWRGTNPPVLPQLPYLPVSR